MSGRRCAFWISAISSPTRNNRAAAYPRHLRQQFDGRTASIPKLLEHWVETTAPDVHLRAALALSEDEWAEPVGEPAFAALLALAASIRHDGLQHPITVARDEHGGFLLESGERRWLAFHLLCPI